MKINVIQHSLAIMMWGIVNSSIKNTFRLFGWFAVELMLKNSGYSESLVIMNAF